MDKKETNNGTASEIKTVIPKKHIRSDILEIVRFSSSEVSLLTILAVICFMLVIYIDHIYFTIACVIIFLLYLASSSLYKLSVSNIYLRYLSDNDYIFDFEYYYAKNTGAYIPFDQVRKLSWVRLGNKKDEEEK